MKLIKRISTRIGLVWGHATYLVSAVGLLLVLTLNPISPICAQRTSMDLNNNWLFKRAIDAQWDPVHIPHTYNQNDPFDDEPGYFRGQATYLKVLHGTKPDKTAKHFIYFGAVNQEATLIVNRKVVGHHLGGYTAFVFDITDVLTFNHDTIEVRVSNEHNPSIPPLKGDFNFYGGIYRDVRLISVPSTHFSMDMYGSQGVFIDPIHVTDTHAELQVRAYVTEDKEHPFFVEMQVRDGEGNALAYQKANLGQEANLFVTTFHLKNPKLWSTDSPYRYHFDVRVVDEKTGDVLDEISMPYGIRYFHFDPDNGFFLNGKHVKLMGVNRHQDLPDKGNALVLTDHLRDMEMISDMGANFLRTAHYPQDPFITSYCDRNGILVSMEIPLDHKITPSPRFYQVCKDMTLEMVYQYYNHPSVIIWAYMNEMGLGMQIERDRDEMEAVAELAVDLEALIRKHDPYRYTMIPNHGDFDIYYEFGLTEIPMIVGWNLYYGWYEEGFEGFGAFVDHAHRKIPDKPMMITEYGAGADPRITSMAPVRFDFSIDWAMAFHRSHIKQILDRPFIAGSAVWNMFDFGSEARQDAVPHVNNKGLCGFDRKTKPLYDLYRSQLRGDMEKTATVSHPTSLTSDHWTQSNVLCINFGATYHVEEENGLVWYPPAAIPSSLLSVTGGRPFQPRDRGEGSDRAISLTNIDPIYQTRLDNTQKLALPVPNGTYEVILHLAHLSDQPNHEQQIRINGRTLWIDELSPFQAFQFAMEVEVADELIEVSFVSQDEAQFTHINGLQLVRMK